MKSWHCKFLGFCNLENYSCRTTSSAGALSSSSRVDSTHSSIPSSADLARDMASGPTGHAKILIRRSDLKSKRAYLSTRTV